MSESFAEQLAHVRELAEGAPLLGESRRSLRAVLAELDRLDRAAEAAKRYFEHCRRVSLSARHAGCDSGEMNVRMALMKEAEDSLGMNESHEATP